ncbi:Nif3-like dinuclear metal center hexameric protein [Candidatus Peregrinibacteria bacterium]|nr:Nif3-like dinuclear metal center hexameric protein [Candidatus Peregrinibacteria bacterium]
MELLNVHEVDDAWCENGLQVEGAENVKKIALGVSASAKFLQDASDWGAEMCIVHHGLFWGKGETKIVGILKKRLQILLSKNISLLNFHIPLDAHAEVGNNAGLIEVLHLKNQKPVNCGFIAELEKPMSFGAFVDLVEEKIGKVLLAEHFSGVPVKKVGVISGGAADFAIEVKAEGADTFLFGEMNEHHYHDLKEMELSFVAAGHYATEKLGVQRLGKRIAEHFSDVEVKFFEENCPI